MPGSTPPWLAINFPIRLSEALRQFLTFDAGIGGASTTERLVKPRSWNPVGVLLEFPSTSKKHCVLTVYLKKDSPKSQKIIIQNYHLKISIKKNFWTFGVCECAPLFQYDKPVTFGRLWTVNSWDVPTSPSSETVEGSCDKKRWNRRSQELNILNRWKRRSFSGFMMLVFRKCNLETTIFLGFMLVFKGK